MPDVADFAWMKIKNFRSGKVLHYTWYTWYTWYSVSVTHSFSSNISKGQSAFFRSVLSQLFSLPLYRLHIFNSISRIHVRLFFLPQLPISMWLRGDTGHEKLVEYICRHLSPGKFHSRKYSKQIFLCVFVAIIEIFITIWG